MLGLVVREGLLRLQFLFIYRLPKDSQLAALQVCFRGISSESDPSVAAPMWRPSLPPIKQNFNEAEDDI